MEQKRVPCPMRTTDRVKFDSVCYYGSFCLRMIQGVEGWGEHFMCIDAYIRKTGTGEKYWVETECVLKMKNTNEFTSLSFPLERYSYATLRDDTSNSSKKHALNDIQWLHYPHRDLEIQFEKHTVSGHDEVTLKVVRGAILFEMLNITRLSKLIVPALYSENPAQQSGIAVITRAPCIGIKWYNDVSKKIARFQMKFSTEEIFLSVKNILEQNVGKVRHAVEMYPKSETRGLTDALGEVSPSVSVDALSEIGMTGVRDTSIPITTTTTITTTAAATSTTSSSNSSDNFSNYGVCNDNATNEGPPTKKILTEASFTEQLATETTNTTALNLLDLRFPTPSSTNKFLYLNQHTQNETIKQGGTEAINGEELTEGKKKYKKPCKSRKNSNDLKIKTTNSVPKDKPETEKSVSMVKPPTPPRTASCESSTSCSQENTETLEDMIVTYINDSHFLQLVKKVDKIWKKLGFHV